MTLRNMACVYIFDGDRVLLMYKTKSRIFTKPMYIGIGGHFEQDELNDPLACLTREIREETGLSPRDLVNLRLKYISLRRTGGEIRQQYIYFADLAENAPQITQSNEGEIRFMPIAQIGDLPISITNNACLRHYFAHGIHDNLIYTATSTTKNNAPDVVFNALEEYQTSY